MHCIDIGIGEEWYGIAAGIISFRNNIVMALDSCPKCIFAQYLGMRVVSVLLGAVAVAGVGSKPTFAMLVHLYFSNVCFVRMYLYQQ